MSLVGISDATCIPHLPGILQEQNYLIQEPLILQVVFNISSLIPIHAVQWAAKHAGQEIE